MRALRGLCSAVGAIVIIAALPGAASADALLPRAVAITEKTSSVVLVDGGRSLALKSTLARRVKRGTVEVRCANALGQSPARGLVAIGGPVSPKLRLKLPAANRDYCVVTLSTESRGKTSTRPIAGIALNAAGYDSLYELTISQYMVLTSAVASESKKRPIDGAALAKLVTGARVLGKKLSAIGVPAPDTAVAVGQMGIFTDGNRTSLTATTPGGRHLYFNSDDKARALSTNILDAINDESLAVTVTSTKR